MTFRGYDYEDKLKNFKDQINKTDIADIISIDEIGFERLAAKRQRLALRAQRMLPLYGYSPKGTKAIGSTHPINRSRINAIVAINSKGEVYFETIEGSVKAYHFRGFIGRLLCIENDVLIMDNVSFHKSSIVCQAYQDKKVIPLWIPPYTPECNPIENFFSVVKNSYRKLATTKIYKQEDIISQSIYSVRKEIYKNCFDHMKKFINGGL